MILLLAVGSALVAGFAAVRYTEERPAAVARPDGGGTAMVVAARDLPVGHLIAEADVQVIRYPSAALPVGYVAELSSAVGRGLTSAVRLNEPILESELAEPGSGGGLPIIFPEGMRAVSVRVDDIVQVAGFVTPRTRVDVLLTMRPTQGNTDQMYTQIIMQNLPVLAAGQTVQRDEQGTPMPVGVVTLMVTPEQAEKLVLAASQGRIQLALRNMLDVDPIVTAGVGDARLFDLGRQAPARNNRSASAPRPRAATPEATVIETYKGGVRSLQRF
jgi:pilus assembly protein CpaB